MRWTLVLGALLWASGARAAEFYVEGPTVQARSEAVALAHAAKRAGYRARIVRRYRHGVGWQYVAVVEGLRSESAATVVSLALTEATGLSVSIYSTAERAVMPAAETDAPSRDSSQEPTPVPLASTADLLLRAVRAHGGLPSAMDRVSSSEAVLFRFRRQVPGGPSVSHTYARRGGSVYLDLRVDEGAGVSSQTVVTEAGAVIVVDERATQRDPEVTRQVTDRFAPERVLAFTLGFAQAATAQREFQLLYDAGEVLENGAPCFLLRFDGDRVLGPIELAIDKETHLLRRIRLEGDGGEVQQRFTNYSELGGFAVPGRVVIERNGAIVDELVVEELDLEPTLPQGWFEATAR